MSLPTTWRMGSRSSLPVEIIFHLFILLEINCQTIDYSPSTDLQIQRMFATQEKPIRLLALISETAIYLIY